MWSKGVVLTVGLGTAQAVQGQVGLEQLRVRVSEEHALRTGARKAWQQAAKASGVKGGPTSSADRLREDPGLARAMENTWQDMRGQQGLPEEVREWIEVGAPHQPTCHQWGVLARGHPQLRMSWLLAWPLDDL